ncbi:MAG TPA: hypothetical protein VEQ16_02340 [Acidocella sp.]|nr:hypothetical protein [Acidocella sp.]
MAVGPADRDGGAVSAGAVAASVGSSVVSAEFAAAIGPVGSGAASVLVGVVAGAASGDAVSVDAGSVGCGAGSV